MSLPDVPSNNRALTSLNISSNGIGGLVVPSGWKDTYGDNGWSGGTRYQHSDGTKQRNSPGKPEGAIAIANAIRDMRALSTLIFGGDRYHKDGKWVTPEPATLEVGMTEANFSKKNLGAAGAIIISAWISHKDNKGALTRLNVSDNSMCGWSSNTSWSSTPRQYEGLIFLLGSISTLQQLDLSSNSIGAVGATYAADAIKDNGALLKLDISNNYIEAEHKQNLQRVCVAGGIELAK
jgi:Leucine-rich repeat (LRR) protein